MKAEEMVGLTSSVLKQFEETYGKIKELRNVFNKQLALDSKIEKIEVISLKHFFAVEPSFTFTL